VEIYIDVIQTFSSEFFTLFDTLISEVKVGLGPDGDLKYPAFPKNLWTFPGVGEFQCYDKYLAGIYNITAVKFSHPEFARLPPSHAVSYNGLPGDIPFFSNGTDNYQSAYGQYFLSWYSSHLLQHGEVILSNAVSILSVFSPSVTISASVTCAYWQYFDPSHAAELTAGYKNDLGQGYVEIVEMLKHLGVALEFPCFDLMDNALPRSSKSAPQELVRQTLNAAFSAGISYEGRNYGPDFNTTLFEHAEHGIAQNYLPVTGFNIFELNDNLFEASMFADFKKFLSALSNPAAL